MDRINGNQLLNMCQHREFKEGDIVIAFQEDSTGNEHTSIYKFIDEDFIDIETEDHIELFDLIECSFLVVRVKKMNETDLALKRLGEIQRKLADAWSWTCNN